jgi:hypothetical protein
MKWLLCLIVLLPLCANAQSVTNDRGWSLSIDPSKGDYSITAKDPHWTIGGSVEKTLHDPKQIEASDSIGNTTKSASTGKTTEPAAGAFACIASGQSRFSA